MLHCHSLYVTILQYILSEPVTSIDSVCFLDFIKEVLEISQI